MQWQPSKAQSHTNGRQLEDDWTEVVFGHPVDVEMLGKLICICCWEFSTPHTIYLFSLAPTVELGAKVGRLSQLTQVSWVKFWLKSDFLTQVDSWVGLKSLEIQPHQGIIKSYWGKHVIASNMQTLKVFMNQIILITLKKSYMKSFSQQIDKENGSHYWFYQNIIWLINWLHMWNN